jgi:serine/threonine-protein kinase
MNSMGQSGSIVGDRYRIVKALGKGGFGHTYLAEDTHRFNELCVLKAFMPQVEGAAALEKAQQLFEREAGILYQLNHPQIPRFRELLRERGRLFLVQDYVDGPTYYDLLEGRRRYDGHFTEPEVLQLLQQLLPVLQYIHSVGVVHRDIAPDNLIQRNADGKPVLIDFGGVKQLVVNVRYQMGVGNPYSTTSGQLTRLGKAGYAPEEQLVSGQVSPSVDLYALGVTARVLLTGSDPQFLLNPYTKTWMWPEDIAVDASTRAVLDRMVASHPSDRYQSAAEVMADLNISSSYGGDGSWATPMPVRIQPMAPPPVYPPPAPTAAVAPRQPIAPQPPGATPSSYAPFTQAAYEYSEPSPVKSRRRSSSGCLQALAGLILLLAAIGGLGWWASSAGWWPLGLPDGLETGISAGGDAENPAFTPEEQARKQALKERILALNVDRSYLTRLTDQLFYEQHPDRQGTPLTDSPEDAPLRAEWDAIANQMLEIIEQNLSPDARERLGRYSPDDLDRWKQQANQLYVSSRALYDLADAKFALLFPGRNPDVFVEQPVDQIWFGLVSDRLAALKSGERLTEIKFAEGSYSQQLGNSLQPGEGQVYILNLSAGQLLRFNLQAPNQATQLSLYVPSPTDDIPYLLADSADTTWSGELPQSGYYEIVVVSKLDQPLTYQLNTAVDNVIDSIPSRPAPPEEKD